MIGNVAAVTFNAMFLEDTKKYLNLLRRACSNRQQ